MPKRPSLDLITSELDAVLSLVSGAAIDAAVHALRAAPHVFVAGEGRSGMVMRMLAVRLMHLGLRVFVIGETITPGIAAGDVLVVCSGSGATAVTCMYAESAAKLGTRVIALTAQVESRLTASAAWCVVIPAPNKLDASDAGSRQYGASLFEQAALLVCEAIVHELQHALDASHDDLWRRHANLE